jgi:hypothetical protein
VVSNVQTNLGAIFREDQKDSIVDLAFKFAIHKINKDPHLLPKTKLIYDIQYVQKADDSFHANKQGDLFTLLLKFLLPISKFFIAFKSNR